MKKLSCLVQRAGIYCCFAFIVILFTNSSASAQKDTGGITPGVLHIKVTEQLAANLERSPRKKNVDNVLLTGIESMDAVHKRFKVRGMNRVFRPAGKYEIKHQKYGLHLWYTIQIDSTESVEAVVSAFRQLSSVTISEPVYKKTAIMGRGNSVTDLTNNSLPGTLPQTSNDPSLQWQWHYGNSRIVNGNTAPGFDIRLFRAWELETGNNDIIVAVVDGGIQTNHEDLVANMWNNPGEIPFNKKDDDGNGYVDDVYGYNFLYDRPTVDISYHATHVAGTVAATTNNGIGVAGVAGGSGIGDGARLMTCEIFNDILYGGAAEAYVYSADEGAIISQNSWSYGPPDVFEQVVLDGIDYFIAEAGRNEFGQQIGPMNGGIVMFAAGNANSNAAFYPAYYERNIAVAASNFNDQKSEYSNYGNWIDITAPGDRILSTYQNGYGELSGTSMACPQVSGVAALILSKYGGPGFTPAMLREKLLQSADNIDADNPSFIGMLGSGRLNAYAALQVNDQISPEQIEDLSVINVKRDTVILQWTAPTDAEGSSAYRYDIRYSTDPITENNFGSATMAWGIPAPGFKGAQESFVVPNLAPSTTYYFAIRSFDFYENASSISNVLEQSTSGTAFIRVVPNNMYMNMLTGRTRVRSASIINSGDLPLTFKIQKNEQENFAEISITEEATVSAKDTLNFLVTFSSHDRVAGIYEQSYTIYHNGFPAWNTGMYLRMDVTDNGEPIIAVNDTLDFKTCFPGIPKTELLTIHNGGSEPLLVSNITSENSVFVPLFTDTLTVAPLSDAIVKVTFSATRLRDYSTRLFIYSNDAKRPLVYVRMLSSLKEPPDISISPASLQALVYTDQKVTLPLTVKNTGLSNLEFSAEFTTQSSAETKHVLILTSDPVTSVLTDLFVGMDDIQADVFPRDSIPKIKLSHLIDYDIVFINYINDWRSQGLNGSPQIIGDVLADYVDQGGKIIMNLFSYYDGQAPFNFTGIQGRFMEETYGPFLPTTVADFTDQTLGEVLFPNHPLMEGVEVLGKGSSGVLELTLTPGAIEIARWNNGYPLVAVNSHVVGINALQYDGVLLSGDFQRLYHNAVNWLMSSSLSVSPQEGIISPGEELVLDVSFDATHLNTVATFERTLLLTHNVPGKDTIKIPVTIDVAGPRFTVSPDSVNITLDSVRMVTGNITLYNNGESTFTFNAALDSLGYGTITPASGTIEGSDSTVFALHVDASSLALGRYENQVIITMDGFGEIIVPVILSIESAPQIAIDPLLLEATVPFREGLVKEFEITNTGGRPLQYTIDVAGAETDNGQTTLRKVLLKEDFDGPTFPPAGWTVIDNEGFGLLWNITSAYGQPNWAGTGEAAMASGSIGYGYEIDTELQSPIIYAKSFKNLNLQFNANHYRGYFDNLDRGILDVDIRSDSSALWKNVLHWILSHGGNYDFPGELVNISLDSVLENASSFQIRWRHYVPPIYDTDEYTQIDDIVLSGNPTEWLSVTPAAGVIQPGTSAIIDAEFFAEDLDAGSYKSTVLVQSNALDNPLISIDASLNVMYPAVAVLQPDSVHQTLQKGDSTIQTVILTNKGGSDLIFSFDEILAPQAMQERKQRRISTAPRRTESSSATISLDDAVAIAHPTSTARVNSVPSSTELYATGFEEFYPGEMDGQEGWIADPFIWSIETQNPLGGLQHFRGRSDGFGWGVVFSPNQGIQDIYPPMSSCTMMINLDSAAGVRWQIVPQAPSSGLVATRIEFTAEGTMRALVQDSLDFYSGYFVEIPVSLPKGYFELRIDVNNQDETFSVYINNKKVFTGDAFVPIIDEVAFLSTMEIPGPKIDIDNFFHYIGIPAISWVKPEPLSGVVPSGESVLLKIHLSAADLPNGTYHHNLTMATNDPEQANLLLPVTLKVSDEAENLLPVLEPLRDTTVVQTNSLIVTFTATDADDSLVFVSLVNPPGFSNKTSESNGSVTYAFSPSLSDQPGLYEMVVMAQDEKNGSASGVFQLNVLPYGVQNFSVINTRTGKTLVDFADSVSLDVNIADFKYLNIRANTKPEKIGSVVFSIDGKKVNLDNKNPYLLQSSILPALSAGQHILVAESYLQQSGEGDKQEKEAVVFIVNTTAVTGFEVVDHLGNFIQELNNGDELKANDPQLQNMNIRARLTENYETGSVIFHLNESLFRIDNKFPFTLAAGSNRWWSEGGLYTVSARPYSNANGKGVAGDSLAVSFNILNASDHNGDAIARSLDSSIQEEKTTGTFMTLYPIPAQGVLYVQFSGEMATKRAQLIIRNIHSQVLYNEFIVITPESHILDLEKMALSTGIYYLQLRTQGMNRNLKFVKE